MSARVYHAQVTRGKVHLWDRASFDEYIRSLKDGQRITLKVQLFSPGRSDQQARYYWAIVRQMANHLGYDSDHLHHELARRFLALDPPDRPIVRVRSTTELSTKEMSRYIDDVLRLAAELEVPLAL